MSGCKTQEMSDVAYEGKLKKYYDMIGKKYHAEKKK